MTIDLSKLQALWDEPLPPDWETMFEQIVDDLRAEFTALADAELLTEPANA